MNLTRNLKSGIANAVRRSAVLLALGLMGEVSTRGQSNSVPPATDFSVFRIISERNIFNPNRFSRTSNYRPRVPTRTVRRNSFSFAGTMSYEEGEKAGRYAFFAGTSADYHKVAKVGETIALFKIAAITGNSVTLLRETNEVVLKIGMQMHEDGQGHWEASTDAVSYTRNAYAGNDPRGQDRSITNPAPETPDAAEPMPGMPMPMPMMEGAPPVSDFAPPPDTSEPAPVAPGLDVPAGPGSDALRHLMDLRAQEEQQSGNRN